MRKSGLLLASLAAALVLVSGVALAATRDCKPNADYCLGTNDSDTLNGSEENDRIYGRDANDTLLGNGGNDTLRGARAKTRLRGAQGRTTAATEIPGPIKPTVAAAMIP